MNSAIVTGHNGSIGIAIVASLKQAQWNVVPWDPRTNNCPPKNKVDALILAHGGNGNTQTEIFAKNALSVGNILHSPSKIVKPHGAIIVITSRRAVVPTVTEWDYAAAKAAAHAYTLALYRKYKYLRITAIACGWIESKMANDAHVKYCIPVQNLCNTIMLVINSKGMRIPEIVMEPIGDAEY